VVAGTPPVREASFRVRATAFPGSHWIEFRKAFKAKRSTRDTGGPPWERIDGPGFTLWLSEVRLLDGRAVPPTWEIRLESLAPLNPAGQGRWAEVCAAIEQFVRASGLEPADAPGAEPRTSPDPARG
jgi:hypothetical protein